MPSTTSFSQGDVVLVPFPFTDLSAIKQRPALVLSPDRSNKVRPDLVVAAITSQIPTIPGDVFITFSFFLLTFFPFLSAVSLTVAHRKT